MDEFSAAIEDRKEWNTLEVLEVKYHLKILHVYAASCTRRNRPGEASCGFDSHMG